MRTTARGTASERASAGRGKLFSANYAIHLVRGTRGACHVRAAGDFAGEIRRRVAGRQTRADVANVAPPVYLPQAVMPLALLICHTLLAVAALICATPSRARSHCRGGVEIINGFAFYERNSRRF